MIKPHFIPGVLIVSFKGRKEDDKKKGNRGIEDSREELMQRQGPLGSVLKISRILDRTRSCPYSFLPAK
jgi:hypothetical protein